MRRPFTDATRPPLERLAMLRAVAVQLSPMHPDTWAEIQAEYAEVVAGMRPACVARVWAVRGER